MVLSTIPMVGLWQGLPRWWLIPVIGSAKVHLYALPHRDQTWRSWPAQGPRAHVKVGGSWPGDMT